MKRWVLTYLETIMVFMGACTFIYMSGLGWPTIHDTVVFGILYTAIVDLRKDVKGW